MPKIESHLLAPESLVGNFSSEKIKIRENSIQARQKKCALFAFMRKSFIIDSNAVQNAKTKDEKMITLNDYLYSGDTVFRILKKYSEDLKRAAEENQSEVDLLHYYFLLQIMELLEHNDFLTAQSQKTGSFISIWQNSIRIFLLHLKGGCKSLIRAEAKFNGYIVAYVYDYYLKNHAYPPVDELKERLTRFRDLIAYRIVISMPKCHVER